MDALTEKARRTIEVFRMIVPGDRAVVAVSGGADSVALLHLLLGLRDALRFTLCVAHLNHMARGKDADEDAQFVARMGQDWGLETYIDRVDVKGERSNFKTSFQETGRILRYRFLETVRKKAGGTKVALGHNADDQVETALMNLFRGSGLKGLAGMPPVRGAIIRPLLDCSRVEVEAFLKARRLPYRSDPTNAAKDYLRNSVRLDLLPSLENVYNKNLRSRILETTRIVRGEEDYLEGLALKIFEECCRAFDGGKAVAVELEKVRNVHPAMQKRLARQAIASVQGDLRRISSRHVDEILELFKYPRPEKEIHLPGSLVVQCRGTTTAEIAIKPNRRSRILREKETGAKEKIELNIPGLTEVRRAALKFSAKLMPSGSGEYRLAEAHQAYLDFDRTGERIIARFTKPGDRFVPLGMTGTKKLKSFFIDEKVPREDRRTVPILTTQNDDIIWVFGKRISQNYCVTPGTRNVLFIEGISTG